MRAAYEEYSDQGFVVLSISEMEREGAVADFIARYDLDYPFVMDPVGTVGSDYQLRSTPTTYFIDPDGLIRDMTFGVVTQGWIEKNLFAFGS